MRMEIPASALPPGWLPAICGPLALAVAFSAGAQQEAPPPAEAPPVAVAAPQPATTSDYIIGPGDSLQIFVWRNPELSVNVPVRPDGKVSTPLVEDMVAVGKKPSELARDIEARLAEYIRSPQVNIIVTNAQSSFSKVTVIGQVRSPQTVPYREGMRIMDLLLAVGGLTEFAAGNRARLVRKDEGGKETRLKVRLKDLLTEGRLDENHSLRPGDLLIVPESVF
ncbi:MAG: XrtA/PEP-CTERM system exopolysaccharide export protein [Gammaproteobacteria bacterium]